MRADDRGMLTMREAARGAWFGMGLVAAAVLIAWGTGGRPVRATSVADSASSSASTSPAVAAAATTTTAPEGVSIVPITPDDGPAVDLPVCRTSSLSVTLGPGEGTTSGTVYRPVNFTNTGSSPCRLQGFPGVSHVAGDDGHQVGRAGAWVGPRGDRVVLEPAASAHSVISVTNVDLVDRETCRPAGVRGFRVYPPGNQAAAFVPSPGVSCSADIGTVRVRSVTPGRGDFGGTAGVVEPLHESTVDDADR